MKLTDIHINPKNPRFIRGCQFDKLVESLEKFPKMMELRPIIVDENNIIQGGNMRYRALKKLGYTEIPDTWVRKGQDLTPEQWREFVVKDNLSYGEWDMDMLASLYDAETLEAWGMNPFELGKNVEAEREEAFLRLKDRFLVPPFSILDTTQQYWSDRKDLWKAIGIKSELGRASGLIYASTAQPPRYYEIKNELRVKYSRTPTTEEVWDECNRRGIKLYGDRNGSTSIFDPVLSEIMYQWFTPEGGTILDPFAGGSVRGIVASVLGYKYYGNDLSEEQIKANQQNAKEVLTRGEQIPIWTTGDSTKIYEITKNGEETFDLIFSCPPYADLEVYSNDPMDISNMKYEDFKKTYYHIVSESAKLLKNNRFAIFTIADVRDKTTGFYRNFISDTIEAFQESGMRLYNEFILINNIGSAAIRANRQFNKGRKNVKRHQNVLVFYKDSPAKSSKKIRDVHEKVLVFYKGDPNQIRKNYETIDLSQNDILSSFVEQEIEELKE